MKYKVTREFLSGTFIGMRYTEITKIKFEEGFICKKSCIGPSYKIISCEEVKEEK